MQSILTPTPRRVILEYVPFAKRFPKCYQKFLEDLKRPRTPVHSVPIKEKYFLDETTQRPLPVVDTPIPVIYPPESQKGLWGGEGIVKGYKKAYPKKAHRKNALKTQCELWVPKVYSQVLYSEILDKYLKTEVTQFALEQIDANLGLDMYLLKTPVQDLNSQLAFNLRRKILLALVRKEIYPDDPEKRERILAKYAEFVIPEEEAEWFGLNIRDATFKLLEKEQYAMWEGTPLKHQLRAELIASLKAGATGGENAKNTQSS